jgi:hypothetical protein
MILGLSEPKGVVDSIVMTPVMVVVLLALGKRHIQHHLDGALVKVS